MVGNSQKQPLTAASVLTPKKVEGRCHQSPQHGDPDNRSWVTLPKVPPVSVPPVSVPETHRGHLTSVQPTCIHVMSTTVIWLPDVSINIQ